MAQSRRALVEEGEEDDRGVAVDYGEDKDLQVGRLLQLRVVSPQNLNAHRRQDAHVFLHLTHGRNNIACVFTVSPVREGRIIRVAENFSSGRPVMNFRFRIFPVVLAPDKAQGGKANNKRPEE